MTSPSKQDSATTLSLNYLAAIESRLGVTWEANNKPVCVPDRFDASALKILKADLDGILKGESSRKALDATREHGKHYIQTVGFGLAADFDHFVKLGFLYGDRVVLWDFLSNRLLLEKSKISKLTLAKTACELLLLKPAVERGAIVLLPHPMEWSSLAEEVAEDLKQQGTRSAAVFGLSMALSAVEEGLNLHPFTMLQNGVQPKASSFVAKHEGDLYSRENYIFQQALSGMLSNPRFAYLENVSAAEFQGIVAEHKELHRKLRKLFNPPAGLSQQQLAIEMHGLQSDLADLIKKQNADIIKYGAEGSEATAMFTTSLLAKLHAVTLGKTGIADICVRLGIALRKWFNKPGKNTIVQAFQALRQQEGREFTETLQRQEQRPAIAASHQIETDITIQSSGDGDQEVKDAIAAFWAAGPWTEQRHEYLLSLPLELAAKVLSRLSTSQRWMLVNHRRFQESYITEYLEDVWPINQSAFWRHMETVFKSVDGLVVGECNGHIEIMCRENMPKYVWSGLLKCLLNVEIKGHSDIAGYFTEMYSEVVLFQTTKASEKKQRQIEFRNWFNTLSHTDRDAVLSFLRKTFDNKIPTWVRRSPSSSSKKRKKK